VAALPPASRVPARPAGTAADRTVIDWSHGEARDWAQEMTRALAERFGRWAVGWRWAHLDLGGGPVGAWCCPRDSVGSTADTLAAVTGALCEWRAWLEELAEYFDRHPLDDPSPEYRQLAWEYATSGLVTRVVERTEADDAWYVHCKQALTWFLTRWGVDPETARIRVGQAVAGRFHSWLEPESGVVSDVAGRLAAAAEPEGPAR